MRFSNLIRRITPAPSLFISLAVAAAVFGIAYDDGSFSLPSRNTLAIAVWWAVILGVGLSVFASEGRSRASLAIGGILAALTAWTLASVFWAPSAENAFDEFNRVALFLGIFVLVTLAATRGTVSRWCDGLAVAASAVAVVALTSRFFQSVFPGRGLATYLPSRATSLSFPVGYWNGLAILTALAIPLLLRAAVSSRSVVARGLAVAPIPAVACVIYLASSRGGVLTALIGSVAFLALSERRWSVVAALFSAAVGCTASIAVLLDRNDLVNGPLGTSPATSQGHSAALLIALICLATAVLYAAGHLYLSRLAEARSFRPSRRLNRGVACVAILAVCAGIGLSHPIRQFHEFKRSPAQLSSIRLNDFAKAHLLSGRGSGRWQFWGATFHEWNDYPVLGEGAGSFGQWWTQHAGFYYPAQDAHSLYLESLGELGILGLALTLGLTLTGAGVGIQRSRRSSGDARITAAALSGVVIAYAVAAGIDWMWELTAVSVFAIVALALVSSSATEPPRSPQIVAANGRRQFFGLGGFGLGAATLVVAWLLICAQAIPLLSQLRIGDSKSASGRGDTADALRAAKDARNLQPWASSPYLQLALVTEDEGQYKRAYSWIGSALNRDQKNWQLWLIAARLATENGKVKKAVQDLRRAVELNPNSPLFSAPDLQALRKEKP